MNSLNLPALEDALEELNVFERDRTDAFVVELAIVLYNSGVSLRKTKRVLGFGITLVFLTVASPHLQPIEPVWGVFKRAISPISNESADDNQEFGTTDCVHETRG